MLGEMEEAERRKHRPVFSRIVKAARRHWTELYKDYGIHHMSGRAVWAGTKSVWAELSYLTPNRRILVRARLAELTGAITPRLAGQLAAIDAMYLGARIIWDPDTGAVLAEASCRCPRDTEEIDDAIAFLFHDFASLLGEERLLAALECAGAYLCGTDVDEWNREGTQWP